MFCDQTNQIPSDADAASLAFLFTYIQVVPQYNCTELPPGAGSSSRQGEQVDGD